MERITKKIHTASNDDVDEVDAFFMDNEGEEKEEEEEDKDEEDDDDEEGKEEL